MLANTFVYVPINLIAVISVLDTALCFVSVLIADKYPI